jgi:hypothetical protein
MPVNLIIRNPLDWDALAIARNANGANRRELSDYVRFLKAQAVWNDLGFFRDFANAKSLNHSFGPNIAFTRASIATYFDSGGTLRTAAAGEPRIDHDPAAAGIPSLGLLIEESRTNFLRNSQAGGSTNGLVWSPSAFVGTGVIATHWGSFRAFGSLEVVGQGTEQGFNYVDVKFSGNNSNAFTVSQIVSGDGYTTIDATSGETWTASAYVKLAGGSLSGVSAVSLATQGRNTGNTVLTENTTTTVTPNSSYQRVVATRAISDPATTKVSLDVVVTASATSTIDITLRIAAPQLERGAFPTSYIPTTSVAVERLADSAIVNPISSFYNQAEGTLFAEAVAGTTNGTASGIHQQTVVQLLENNTGDILAAIYRPNSTTNGAFFVGNSGTQADLSQAGFTAGTNARLAAAYKVNDFALSVNGAAATTDTSGSLPTATTLRIGRYGTSSGFLNGHIRKVAYFPKRLSNALLQSLTT